LLHAPHASGTGDRGKKKPSRAFFIWHWGSKKMKGSGGKKELTG
jgi:hypothetical protein